MERLGGRLSLSSHPPSPITELSNSTRRTDSGLMQNYSASSRSFNQDDRPSKSIPRDEGEGRYKAAPVQLTAWAHEAKNCSEEVVVDLSLLPPGTKEGDVAELRLLHHTRKKVLFTIKKPSEEFRKLLPNAHVSSYSITF